ncbi:FAD-binding oxidoreductase [Frankia sp. CNm7]|uniref:FAD-binding oxidoreductase n=1 Tax=Frankia nepalensis TaxID=1836974 RepID=A0A937USJ0_9ACTN|nr:FAD-binding protein [Frankia nepalensis]MBL7523030.1 FAD-binding oxidoreductase [Frankia nepalensis]MBL7632537.1 FAD-binding oxidoreductase [Frankia nepalensis]
MDETPGVCPDPGRAAALRGLCGGAVLLPGDDGYDVARAAWNLAVDQRPAAIAYAGDAGEVAEVLRAATAAGLRVAPQGTGHNAGPLPPLSEVVLLRTSGMVGVRVDAESRRARVRAGARWIDVLAATGPLGLGTLHGSGPGVGVVGYSLGGGIGWYSRALGLQANSVTAIDLVTADGTALRVDADHDRELFWALRGGGGSFGVVTALEFALHPARPAVAGLLAWDWSRTHAVLDRWARWTTDLPDEAATSFRIQRMPATGPVPPRLRGRTLAVVGGALLDHDDDASARRLLGPLRALRPEVDTFAATVPPGLGHGADGVAGAPGSAGGIGFGDFGGFSDFGAFRAPAPVIADSVLLSRLPPAAVDAFTAAAGPGSGSTHDLVELRHLGGALARRPPDAGSLPLVDGQFLMVSSTVADSAAARRRGRSEARGIVAALHPYASGTSCLNFTTRQVDVSTGYQPESWSRLRAMRRAVDPAELLVANHPVPPS